MTLEWAKPRGTAGTKKPTGYVIEYRPADGDEWIKAPLGQIKGTTATGKPNPRKIYSILVCINFYKRSIFHNLFDD